MSVYDEDKQSENNLVPDSDEPKKSYSPEELRNIENKTGERYSSDSSISGEKKLKKDIKSDALRDAREQSQTADAKEADELKDTLRGYFNDEAKGEISGRANSLLGNKKSRRLLIGGLAVTLPMVLFALAFVPNLLGLLKIENFLQNIDAATFSRLNASFDRRSDKWIKSYVALRMTEIDGEANPGRDTLYFRANKVDTNNPIRDWYRTLRTSNFEKNVFEKNGIRFTTAAVTQADGSIRFKQQL